MTHFSNGFKDELEKLAQMPSSLPLALKALPIIQKLFSPTLATGAIGALIGARVAEDPGIGAAKGALIGIAAGMTPTAFYQYFKKGAPNISYAKGLPATLTGAGAGAALGSLASDENRGFGAALGALAGATAAGLPTYSGLAKEVIK